ncbi:hypothetical protein D3Y67_32040, partial [Escherichia coli]
YDLSTSLAWEFSSHMRPPSGRAGTLTGLHPMQVCRCRRPPHPVTFRRSSSTRCGFGAAPAFVCGRPVTGAARPDGGRM